MGKVKQCSNNNDNNNNNNNNRRKQSTDLMMMMIMIIIIIIIVYLREQLNSQRPITKLAYDAKIYKEYKHGVQNTERCSNNYNNKTK
jgi:predicted nucleic acid-binding Zn ribbon protein